MSTAWDSELANFLNDLSAVQDESLSILTKKREMIVASDAEGLAGLAQKEGALVERLQACLDRRQELLDRAANEGLPSESLQQLASALPNRGGNIAKQIRESSSRARLLKHQSVTNWLLVQRTLLHLSQTIEILATGGRMQPTYTQGSLAEGGGTLVNRVI